MFAVQATDGAGPTRVVVPVWRCGCRVRERACRSDRPVVASPCAVAGRPRAGRALARRYHAELVLLDFCGARRMSQTAAHLVDHAIPPVLVRQWVRVFNFGCRSRCACGLPHRPSWSCRCCRWCSAWPPSLAAPLAGSSLTRVRRPRWRCHADPALRVRRRPEHPPAVPGPGRRAPPRRRWRARLHRAGAPTDDELDALAAHHHCPAHEDAHASGRAGRGDGPDLPDRAGCRARAQRAGRCAPAPTGSACVPRCGWKRTTASGWSSGDAASPAPRCRTKGCGSTPPGKSR